MDKMKIKVWSDIACPYCYIGKRLLAQALSNFPHSDEIEIVRLSYELHPELPKAPLGKSLYAFLAEQNGIHTNQQKKNMKKLLALANEAGLEYNLDKVVVTNTSDALRLIKLAVNYDLAGEIEEALFKAYFTDGENVSDHDTLIHIGTDAGIPCEEIERLLDGNMFADEIGKDMESVENTLKFIPFYMFVGLDILDTIEGSIPIETYSSVLNNAYYNWKNGNAKVDPGERITGEACSIDGHCSI
jgi:predicted DsbA family dithiol-disulfide isomerase